MNLQLRRRYNNFSGCCLDSQKDPFESCACEKVDLYNTKTFEKTHKIVLYTRGNLKKICNLAYIFGIGAYHLTNL